uniref:Uncharacterized protein n=1 Tax=Arundo donax TaxID=35708 RepID=A0A0A9AIU9_ARUDO
MAGARQRQTAVDGGSRLMVGAHGAARERERRDTVDSSRRCGSSGGLYMAEGRPERRGGGGAELARDNNGRDQWRGEVESLSPWPQQVDEERARGGVRLRRS